MTTSMIDKEENHTEYLPSTIEAADFIADYSSYLYGCGATCIRIEKNATRMVQAFGLESDITIMPSHIHVSVWKNSPADAIMTTRRIQKCGISFDINSQLSRLSWEVADGKTDYRKATELFHNIIKRRPTNKWEVLILTSFANAAFCRLFGGDAMAMLIVFLSTLAGYRIKQVMLEDKRDIRLVFLCSAFFSAAVSAGGHIFGWGDTPEIALGTSVLYLIPGVPYISAVSDMIDRHYLCAFSRFVDASILTACLSLGLCAGMFILGLEWF